MNDEFKKYVVQPVNDTVNTFMEVTDEAYLVYVHENDLDMVTARNLAHAADHQCFGVQDLKELWSPTDVMVEVPTVAGVAKISAVDVDDLITKYAERLQDVYDFRTAGSYTFVGVLATFLMELEGK